VLTVAEPGSQARQDLNLARAGMAKEKGMKITWFFDVVLAGGQKVRRVVVEDKEGRKHLLDIPLYPLRKGERGVLLKRGAKLVPAAAAEAAVKRIIPWEEGGNLVITR